MRFRFGWRKKDQGEKQIYETINEDNQADLPVAAAAVAIDRDQVVVLNSQPSPELPIATRILVFGDTDESGNLYTLFLRSKGYEVLSFQSPDTCALVAGKKCTCPRDHVCADLFLVYMEMEGMTGLELIRRQSESGCRALSRNKAVLANAFTSRQEYDIRALGCIPLSKPFRLKDLLAWVDTVEKNIPPGRKLTPYHELFTTD